MADIYIVYAGEDKEVARGLHQALSARWSVWWDDDIVGSYPSVPHHPKWVVALRGEH
ncbi:MAG: hypothetical protein HC888_08065 [Candidatus Competibacteraceae bacterium]|nr:hypothetical protein [Candidatus Competibacteraceae bacterium]